MKKEDKYFEWLKHTHKWYGITSMTDVPILILLYYLGYHIAFWIVLVLFIINLIGISIHLNSISKKAKLKIF